MVQTDGSHQRFVWESKSNIDKLNIKVASATFKSIIDMDSRTRTHSRKRTLDMTVNYFRLSIETDIYSFQSNQFSMRFRLHGNKYDECDDFQ